MPCVRLLYNAVIIVKVFTMIKGGVFMDRTAYKNQHIKEHYDRINFVMPKGEKARIKKIYSEIGQVLMNILICLCVMTLQMVQAEC